jgi:hypothetical protein
MADSQTAAAPPGAAHGSAAGTLRDKNALTAFSTLANAPAADGAAAALVAPRRTLNPTAFALAFAKCSYDTLHDGRFVLDPGRSPDELELLALTGAMFDQVLLGRLYRGRVAEMLAAASTPEEFARAVRALRLAPQWAIESEQEREERLNAMAGFSVEETRQMRAKRHARTKQHTAQRPATKSRAPAPEPSLDQIPATTTAPVLPPQGDSQRLAPAKPEPAPAEPPVRLNRAQRRRLEALQRGKGNAPGLPARVKD